MGLLSGILLLPLAPVRGTIWVAEKLADQAAREQDDEVVVRRLLVEAELALERGELTLEQYEEAEDALLDRLDRARTVERG
jgi:gas vesicle protein GvpG